VSPVTSLREQWRGLRRRLGVLRRLPPFARGAAVSRWLESRAQREERLLQALALPEPHLLFVCHGNIMRSAFAREHACALAATHSPDWTERLHGAGTHATLGASAHPDALEAAVTLGVSLVQHQACPLAQMKPGPNLIVVCMDQANEAHAMVWAGAQAGRVFLIGDVSGAEPREVLDPYGRGPSTTEQAFARVRAYVGLWMSRLSAGPVGKVHSVTAPATPHPL